MVQLTVRGIDPEFECRIRELARSSGKSLSRTVVDLLEERFRRQDGKRRRPGASLGKLAGGWAEADAAEFQAATRIFGQIDADLWR